MLSMSNCTRWLAGVSSLCARLLQCAMRSILLVLQAVQLGRVVKPLVMQAYNEWVLRNPETAKKIEDVAKYVSFLLPVCNISFYELERGDHACYLSQFRAPQRQTQPAF